MSRIGRKPLPLPKGVTFTQAGGTFGVKGPKGELKKPLPTGVSIKAAADKLNVERADDSPNNRAKHGLVRANLANMIKGVTTGYSRSLEINGVGYRAQKVGDHVMFQLGYSHPVAFEAPPGVTINVEGNNRVVVTGADKELVVETAARIRRIRPPEPYKGKGIKYAEEQIRRKAGKAGGKGKK